MGRGWFYLRLKSAYKVCSLFTDNMGLDIFISKPAKNKCRVAGRVLFALKNEGWVMIFISEHVKKHIRDYSLFADNMRPDIFISEHVKNKYSRIFLWC